MGIFGFASDTVWNLLPLGLSVITHMVLGMLTYGPLAGKQFIALAHPKGLKDGGPWWLYAVAMGCAVVAHSAFYTMVVATATGGHVLSLTALGLAVFVVDVAGNIRLPAFEFRPMMLQGIHLLYHCMSIAMAVFWFAVLGTSRKDNTNPDNMDHVMGTQLFELQPMRLAAAFLAWEAVGVLWYGGLFKDLFVRLAFGKGREEDAVAASNSVLPRPSSLSRPLTPLEQQQTETGMTLTHIGALAVAAVYVVVVRVWGGNLLNNLVACVTVTSVSAVMQLVHAGFEHRPIALAFLHQAGHVVAAAAVAVALAYVP